MSASEVNPADVTFGSDVIYRLQSGDERVAIRAAISIRSDQSTFYTEIDLKVTLNEAEFFKELAGSDSAGVDISANCELRVAGLILSAVEELGPG